MKLLFSSLFLISFIATPTAQTVSALGHHVSRKAGVEHQAGSGQPDTNASSEDLDLFHAKGLSVIEVLTATYGTNCGAKKNNARSNLKESCDGRRRCNYVIKASVIGDPVYGCKKNYVADYRCERGGQTRRVSVDPEAGFGSTIILDCNGDDPEDSGTSSEATAPQAPTPSAAQSPHENGPDSYRIPHTLSVCELDQCKDGIGGGVWTFDGLHGSGMWPGGAVATLTVEHFGDDGIVIDRTDEPDSTSPGLTARYTGTLHNNRVDGNATWSWPGHWDNKSGSGRWFATIGCGGGDPQNLDAKKALARGDEAKNDRKPLEALCWWSMAANLGDARAKTNVGALYLFGGFGFRQNYEEAKAWFDKAKSDDPQALFFLGLMYHYGWYFPSNPMQSNRLLNEAADLGELQARDYLVCTSTEVEKAMKQVLVDLDSDPSLKMTKIFLGSAGNLDVVEENYKVSDIALVDSNSETHFSCTATIEADREVSRDNSQGEKETVDASAIPIIQTFGITKGPDKKCVVTLPYLGFVGSPVRPFAVPRPFHSKPVACPTW